MVTHRSGGLSLGGQQQQRSFSQQRPLHEYAATQGAGNNPQMRYSLVNRGQGGQITQRMGPSGQQTLAAGGSYRT